MKRRFFQWTFLGLAIFMTGCAGYHFNINNNPLIGYDIHSLAVPMFVNRSNIPEVSSLMTREIILALNDFSGLKIYGGDSDAADAVLIGIIESKNLLSETFATGDQLFTTGDVNIKKSIGNRTDFYYPITTNYQFTLRIYLIRRPTAQDIELLTSDIGKNVIIHPKVVLQDVLPISGNFSRVANENTSSVSGGAVNFVKNKGIFNKSLQDICQQTAVTFKQVVLNAF